MDIFFEEGNVPSLLGLVPGVFAIFTFLFFWTIYQELLITFLFLDPERPLTLLCLGLAAILLAFNDINAYVHDFFFENYS